MSEFRNQLTCTYYNFEISVDLFVLFYMSFKGVYNYKSIPWHVPRQFIVWLSGLEKWFEPLGAGVNDMIRATWDLKYWRGKRCDPYVICWTSTRSKILQSETASPRWEPLPLFQNTQLSECGGTWSHFFLLTWRHSLPTSRLFGLAHHLGLLSSAKTCAINTTLHCSGSHGPPISPKDGITDSTRCSLAPTQRCGSFQGQKSWKHDFEIIVGQKGPPSGSTFWLIVLNE